MPTIPSSIIKVVKDRPMDIKALDLCTMIIPSDRPKVISYHDAMRQTDTSNLKQPKEDSFEKQR